MVYKSQKAASLYSEFANSKNLKEAKIMPGTFNGTTLTISATPVDGALIPDKSATNVAGIAIVGSDMYCVKTTGLKTTLLKTTDYMATKATAVKKDLNWFALGLTKTVKETIGVGVNEKAALSSDKNCPFVYINFDFTLVNKVASL